MAGSNPRTEAGAPLSRELRRLADALGRLIREHVELARAEVGEDLRRRAVDAALATVALPFLLAALLLIDAALALALGRRLGEVQGFAIVGVANLAVGAILGALALARFRRARPLAATAEELRRDRLLAARLRQELREEAGSAPSRGIRAYPTDDAGAATS